MVSSSPLPPPMAIHSRNPVFFFKISQINHTQLKNPEKASHHAQNNYKGEFSSGPVVRTLCFHCWGSRFNPRLANQDLAGCAEWLGVGVEDGGEKYLKWPTKPDKL